MQELKKLNEISNDVLARNYWNIISTIYIFWASLLSMLDKMLCRSLNCTAGVLAAGGVVVDGVSSAAELPVVADDGGAVWV